MAINKKLITFDKKAAFLGANGINGTTSPTEGYFGQIPAWSMVFIKDTGEIWHLGVYFGKPISSQISSGGSYTNGFVYTPDGTNYYYKTVTLWGNTLSGSTVNLKDKLITEETVGGTTYRLAYGGRGIERRTMSGTTPVDTYLMMFGENLVTIDAVTKVRGGLLTVSSSNSYSADITAGIQTAGAIKSDLYLYDTSTYISTNYSLGKTWNSIKLFSSGGTQIDLSQSKPAIITIQESNHAANTDWQPWIAGGDMSSYSSWGIGLGGDAFYIGRIKRDETNNLLSLYWKFNVADGITLSGTTKYIKASGVQDAGGKVFLADGTLGVISEMIGMNEATTDSIGGFKLSSAKASSTQTMSASTTGAGKYPIKMNADSTLYVEITQANTWKAANSTQEGYVPKLENGGTALANSTNDYVLAFVYASSGTLVPSWKKLPANAYNNDNTTYKLKVNNTTNGDSTNGVNLGTIYAPTSSGTGFLKGTAGENGAITWSWDNSTYNNYSLTKATTSALGGIIISNTLSTAVSLTSSNGATANRYYGVQIDKDGKAFVNIPWEANTHYIATPILGGSDATSNATSDTANDATYLNIVENSAKSGGVKIIGSGGTSIKAKDGVLTITSPSLGTGSTNAAKGDHTHTLSIATDNGTNEVTLAANTKYKLTAGGKTLIFTTPADNNTWNAFTAATDLAAGTAGYIQAPAGAQNKFFRGDNTWQPLTSNITSALYIGASNGTASAKVDNDPYLIFVEGSSYSRYKLEGAGGITVSSNASGNLKFTGTTYSVFTGATENADGSTGLVKKPTSNDRSKFLRGDCTWLTINLNVTSALYVGASNGTSTSAQSTNGNVYLIFAEGSSYSRYKIIGSGRASVTSDSNGHITIDSAGYSNFVKSGANAASGLVPKPSTTEGTTKFLREDGTWQVPSYTSLPTFYNLAFNNGTSDVLTYDPDGSASKKIIKGSNITFDVNGDNLTISATNTWNAMTGATSSANGSVGYINATPPKDGYNTKYWRADGSWAVPTNNIYKLTINGSDNGTTGGTSLGSIYAPTSSGTGFLKCTVNNNAVTWSYDNNTYLPTSGGTISNSLKICKYLQFEAFPDLNNIYGTGSCSIYFNQRSDYIRFDNVGNLNLKGNTVWHSGNFSPSDYLPLIGGTISNGSNWATITFTRTNLGTGCVGGLDGNGLYFYHKAEGSTGNGLKMYLKENDGLRVGNKLVSLDGHKHAYTDLTGSTTTADQVIVSSGTANEWTLKTLGSNAFTSTIYATPDTTTTLTRASGNLTKDTWSDVGTFANTIPEGTWVISFTIDGSLYSGVFSRKKSDTMSEEIDLHASGTSTKRIYARTTGNKVQIITADATFNPGEITFNFRKLI